MVSFLMSLYQIIFAIMIIFKTKGEGKVSTDNKRQDSHRKTNHSDAVTKISTNTRVDKETVALVLDGLNFTIVDLLQEPGDSVVIKNLGKFYVEKCNSKIDTLDGTPKDRGEKLSIKFSKAKYIAPYEEKFKD